MISVTKKAYARGIGEALQQNGSVSFPTPDVLKVACDRAAALIYNDPARSAVTHDECIKVAQVLQSVSGRMRGQGKFASRSTDVSLAYNAHTAIGDLIEKIAEAATVQQDGSSTMVGMDDHENTLAAAAAESDMALMEMLARPEDYALVGQGNANFSESEAARIGYETAHPGQPTDALGSNSVTEASKEASYNRLLRKLAEQSGSPTLVGMGDHENTLPAAAGDHVLGQYEHLNRPEDYAVVGQGNANFSESEAARIGEEQAHPGRPTDAPGSNSVTEASKEAMYKRASFYQSGATRTENMLARFINAGY